MIVRRRCFTMLELLISMTLTVMILGVLTYFYQQMTMAGVVLDRQQGKNFEERYVEHRLGTVLPHATAPSEKNGNFHFFTTNSAAAISMPGSPSLVFVFDNCVQSDKDMAYLVIGRIMLDQQGRLLLVIWPSEKRWVENEPIPQSYEVLMEGVKELSFSFFVPPIKGKTDLKTGSPRKESEQDPFEGNRGRWIDTGWMAEWRQLPAMIRIRVVVEVNGEDEELLYAFPFPNVEQPITYVN